MKTLKISVEQFYVENASSLGLHLLAGADGLKRIIKEPTVNRPGLALAGFTNILRTNAFKPSVRLRRLI